MALFWLIQRSGVRHTYKLHLPTLLLGLLPYNLRKVPKLSKRCSLGFASERKQQSKSKWVPIRLCFMEDCSISHFWLQNHQCRVFASAKTVFLLVLVFVFCVLNKRTWGWRVAQLLFHDMGSISIPTILFQQFLTLVPRDSMPSSGFYRYQVHTAWTWCTDRHTCNENTHMHKLKINKNNYEMKSLQACKKQQFTVKEWVSSMNTKNILCCRLPWEPAHEYATSIFMAFPTYLLHILC